MLTATLYLIQSDFSSTEAKLTQLQTMLHHGDCVVLMGDAVLHAHHVALTSLEQLYVLDTDTTLLNSSKPAQLNVISYSQFADICLAHTRCMTIK